MEKTLLPVVVSEKLKAECVWYVYELCFLYCWWRSRSVVTDTTYKGVCMTGGVVKEASSHMMDLVLNWWDVEGGMELDNGGASGEVSDDS
jgi:hypothetical protein